MDLCFSLKCTKNKDDDYRKRDGSIYTIPNYVTDDYILSCRTNSFSSLINLKNSGNRHYKSYKFNQAVHCYTKALVSFTQEKNENNQGNKSNESSFEFSNVIVSSNINLNDIEQNKVSNVQGHSKKNSTGVPRMSNSIISHISSPLASSSNINFITNSKISNNNKQFPTSDASSYKILKIKGDDEYSNNFEENHMEVSFNSTSPKSPDINPKVEFINHVEAQYQDTQNVDSNKSKDKRNKKNTKTQKVYIPHPKVKPTDVMVLYSTLLANRSASYIRLKQYKKANIDADRIIEIRPNWIKGYYRKAEALKGLKRYLESLDYYHQALKFNPSSEKILNAISTIEILLRNEELGIKIYQLVPGYDICVKKSIFKPIQYILFSYALQMQNYIYILADVKTKQCLLIDACWDIEGILEHVHKEKLKVIGAIYTHFHIDHTGGIPPPPYNKYMVKVEGMVKLSKIYPDIPFFIGPRDIDFVLKQNPDFNRNRFVPIEDRQVLTLDDIVNLNKSKLKGKTHINETVKTNQEKPIPPPKDPIYSSEIEGKLDVLDIKNDIISDDGAIIEKDEIFSAPISEINSPIDNNFKFSSNKLNNNNKTLTPVKGRPLSDYKVKRLSNLNEDAFPIQDDNATDVYSNCNLNEVSNNDFENALNNESSMIENDNLSNICYDGENSLKFYSNLSDQENNIIDGNKKTISISGNRGVPWTSSLERPKNKFKFVEDNKNNFYNNRINDTISTISLVNIDKKDYPNPYVKSSHKIDEFRIQFIFTPGHTLGSMCILVNDERLFSGDTLLIGTCGRIDLPESSPEEMYDSLINVLGHLEDDIVVYPGHSYGGDEWTTIAQEKLFGSMYDHGSYETWYYELTGCAKNNDGASSHHSENRNEIMAMTPVSPAASHTLPRLDLSSKFSKKELLEEGKSNKEESIPLSEEKIKESILLNSIKKDEEGKGYFNNHEYFNNSINNNNNKVLKLVNPSPIPSSSTINGILTPTAPSTDHQVTTFDKNTPQKTVSNHRKINSSSNKNKVVTYSKRKESLHIKPNLQKQKIVIRKSDEALKKHQQQHQQQHQHQQQQQQPSSMPSEMKNNSSTSKAMKIILDNENITDSEKIVMKNIAMPSKAIVKTPIKINNQNNEISSISSSTASSDSLSISTPSLNEEIEHFADNPVPLIKDMMSKPKSKESLREEPFIDTGAKTNQNVEEASSVGVNSYDQILPSSINEQMNKSSEIDESYDSENYDKNSRVLKGLSQNSFGLSPFERNNLMMTELYPNEIESLPTPVTDEEDHVDYNDYNDLRPVENIKKKKSFLNNVFKKRSFERKHHVMNPEE